MNKTIAIIFIFVLILGLTTAFGITKYLDNKRAKEISIKQNEQMNNLEDQINQVLTDNTVNRTKIEDINKTIVKDKAYWEEYWRTHPGSTGGGASTPTAGY